MPQDCQDALFEVLETLVGLDTFLAAFAARNGTGGLDFEEVRRKLAEAEHSVLKAADLPTGGSGSRLH
ncbi:hypothetical protein SAMN05444722_0540 [Rhodovulum sp. ES.010]|uniref:hypothetical protein n=1 Tax=Rhodovulum sp. ES.010 TaxID=1882821 RepID=UPI00092A39BB|nr:hypothetical protein [Rhodovulum sp. ES.010]SIO13022.1 hypothetical protein SAMN05444722_0540 [Rhodovulum sp. ES.010]